MMKIHMKNENNDIKLKLYQDQFNIILKTMQENMSELTRYGLSSRDENPDTWLKVEIFLSNFSLVVVNATLYSVREQNVNKKILENKASLCEIILEDFIVKIDMNKDSSKYIRINSENFKVVDLRFHSKFNNEESTPLIFMYSEDQENPEKRTSVKGFKDLSPKKPTLMKSSKSYDPRLEVIKDKIERILDIKILINEEKKISIEFAYGIILFIPDFLHDLGDFFQCPSNPGLFQDPSNIKILPNPNPPRMTVNLAIQKIHVLLLSSLTDMEKSCILLRLSKLEANVV